MNSDHKPIRPAPMRARAHCGFCLREIWGEERWINRLICAPPIRWILHPWLALKNAFETLVGWRTREQVAAMKRQLDAYRTSQPKTWEGVRPAGYIDIPHSEDQDKQ
jgi:hypothetical protein